MCLPARAGSRPADQRRFFAPLRAAGALVGFFVFFAVVRAGRRTDLAAAGRAATDFLARAAGFALLFAFVLFW